MAWDTHYYSAAGPRNFTKYHCVDRRGDRREDGPTDWSSSCDRTRRWPRRPRHRRPQRRCRSSQRWKDLRLHSYLPSWERCRQVPRESSEQSARRFRPQPAPCSRSNLPRRSGNLPANRRNRRSVHNARGWRDRWACIASRSRRGDAIPNRRVQQVGRTATSTTSCVS